MTVRAPSHQARRRYEDMRAYGYLAITCAGLRARIFLMVFSLSFENFNEVSFICNAAGHH